MEGAVRQMGHNALRMYQYYLDKSTPHAMYRWIGTLAIIAIYCWRIYSIQGYYIVSCGLGMYLLDLLSGFLTLRVDPEIDGPILPTKGSDEFEPFVPLLPEFKFWYSLTRGICIAFVMTFFSMFDTPVYWPVLFFYWLILLVIAMRRQIAHMIKYKYIPFRVERKQNYGRKQSSAGSSGD